MHNILLGLAKNQWYYVWIKGRSALRANTDAGTQRELQVLHDFLASLEVPPWVGRLPSRLGEPAGGSLSADEYKLLLTVFGPLAIPCVWDMHLGEATTDYAKALERANVGVMNTVLPQSGLVQGHQAGRGMRRAGRGHRSQIPEADALQGMSLASIVKSH
ncbi:uncharacterized protein EI90DRAFT_2347995 [Cantharellus anzutake]|uniref:uncharacterized protein n=1 Tax=Cantharellus anzutake TaxID=1750568 RepID=UPI00190598CF|nr:uncharacterized protein EI90DRAFT_2347995 [Cantharellus anzutake]KAF8324274.1 hypothetical protein EI90DRAFT_2347995 [Cantharellus anzutake]